MSEDGLSSMLHVVEGDAGNLHDAFCELSQLFTPGVVDPDLVAFMQALNATQVHPCSHIELHILILAVLVQSDGSTATRTGVALSRACPGYPTMLYHKHGFLADAAELLLLCAVAGRPERRGVHGKAWLPCNARA